MSTYANFFRACRIPGQEKDELYIHTNEDKNSDHIIVACRNQVCLDPLSTDANEILKYEI